LEIVDGKGVIHWLSTDLPCVTQRLSPAHLPFVEAKENQKNFLGHHASYLIVEIHCIVNCIVIEKPYSI
jgi:hypothetical protein